jgi:hypothetical protein
VHGNFSDEADRQIQRFQVTKRATVQTQWADHNPKFTKVRIGTCSIMQAFCQVGNAINSAGLFVDLAVIWYPKCAA